MRFTGFAAQHSTAQHSTAQHSTAQHSLAGAAMTARAVRVAHCACGVVCLPGFGASGFVVNVSDLPCASSLCGCLKLGQRVRDAKLGNIATNVRRTSWVWQPAYSRQVQMSSCRSVPQCVCAFSHNLHAGNASFRACSAFWGAISSFTK